MRTTDVWSCRTGFEPASGKDLSGFDVRALDGTIGKVDESTYDSDHNYLIVDTGHWIFGKKVMLPAGVINKVDEHDGRIWVNRRKGEIEAAPGYEVRRADWRWRRGLGSYYVSIWQGFRHWQ